jgi:hypothetical protein
MSVILAGFAVPRRIRPASRTLISSSRNAFLFIRRLDLKWGGAALILTTHLFQERDCSRLS